MDRKTLKKRIVKKFGSVRHFANRSEQILSAWTIIHALNGTRKRNLELVLREIERKIQDLEPLSKEITDDERKFVRIKIRTNYRNAAEFCRLNPEFKQSFVSNVITGTKKNRDDRFRLLIKTLKNEDEEEFTE